MVAQDGKVRDTKTAAVSVLDTTERGKGSPHHGETPPASQIGNVWARLPRDVESRIRGEPRAGQVGDGPAVLLWASRSPSNGVAARALADLTIEDTLAPSNGKHQLARQTLAREVGREGLLAIFLAYLT